LKRVIVDYRKLTTEILNLLVEKFPDGYGIKDIIKFTNHKEKYIEAVEVSTGDTMYLVKISDELVDSMESHDDDDIVDSEISEDVDIDGIDDVDLDDDE